jgi:phospholipid N-methyltransferase
MRTKTIPITPEIRAVLERANITSTSLTITEQLDRNLYQAVNKVLEAGGGKWDRKAKAHLFTGDPRAALGIALETGKITRESIVDEKQTFQIFHTPRDLARRMIRIADIKPGDRVLEPSAGEGAIALAAQDAGAIVTAIEIRPEAVLKLNQVLISPALCADFLKVPAGDDTYDVILMNPPFTRNQDIQHVQHALGFLAPKGRLVSIMSPHFTFADDVPSVEFRRMLDIRGVFEPLPAGTFKEAGTNVSTVLVTVCV